MRKIVASIVQQNLFAEKYFFHFRCLESNQSKVYLSSHLSTQGEFGELVVCEGKKP